MKFLLSVLILLALSFGHAAAKCGVSEPETKVSISQSLCGVNGKAPKASAHFSLTVRKKKTRAIAAFVPGLPQSITFCSEHCALFYVPLPQAPCYIQGDYANGKRGPPLA
jgi:hypothetical protein